MKALGHSSLWLFVTFALAAPAVGSCTDDQGASLFDPNGGATPEWVDPDSGGGGDDASEGPDQGSVDSSRDQSSGAGGGSAGSGGAGGSHAGSGGNAGSGGAGGSHAGSGGSAGSGGKGGASGTGGAQPCTGECTPRQVDDTGVCDLCGKKSRTCGDDCKWGNWGDCGGQGVCSPPATETQACKLGDTQQRTCSQQCQWSDWQPACAPCGDVGATCATTDPPCCPPAHCCGATSVISNHCGLYTGESCANASQCCSGHCGDAGTCCRGTSSTCSQPADCCSKNCIKVDVNTDGVCT
jgi:hypothetical protein